ncbi:hypothetical protein EAF04_002461 [Stromatinia cepivora]|nr:hypothetical protein EAF04_002461 [Stromatinia cepivora]
MLDFCLRLFCPSPGRKQRRERYINPTSLALTKSRRRYPLPSPVYPLPAPILRPPEQIYEQPCPITPVYYPEPELEPEPEFLFPQEFQRVRFEPIPRRELDPGVQQVHFIEPEPEIYLPLRRPRSPPSRHIHLIQQVPPPYIPSPPPTPSPPTHHINVLPPPILLPPAPRTPSPPHTHIHLLAPAPAPAPSLPPSSPPTQTLALIPLPKPKPKMNFLHHPHAHAHPNPHPHHHHNHNHNQRNRSPSVSRSPSPITHPYHIPQNHSNNQPNNTQTNPTNPNNIPLADLIRDVLQRYLQINLPPGTAVSIARLMARSRDDVHSDRNSRSGSRDRSRDRKQGRGRRGGNGGGGNGNGSGRRRDGKNRQAVSGSSSDSDSDSNDIQVKVKTVRAMNEEIRRYIPFFLLLSSFCAFALIHPFYPVLRPPTPLLHSSPTNNSPTPQHKPLRPTRKRHDQNLPPKRRNPPQIKCFGKISPRFQSSVEN